MKKKIIKADADHSGGEDGSGSGRVSAWNILAAPLTSAPDSSMLSHYAGLRRLSESDSEENTDGGIAERLRALALGAEQTGATEAAEDYQDLFIGLGRGKVVPYGSWHLSGALMDLPLARLRTDLRALGFARRPDVKEPEDHAGALCEIMAMLAADDSALSFGTQKKFYEAHIGSWMGGLFAELTTSAETPFYRALGEFGGAFLAFETRYFSMPF